MLALENCQRTEPLADRRLHVFSVEGPICHGRISVVFGVMTPKDAKIRLDASEKTCTPWGGRILDRLSGKPLASFARVAGLHPTTLRDIVFKVSPGAEAAVKIAQALDVSVEWLITGKDRRPAGDLRDAADADWVQVPHYRLSEFTETGKPEPIETIPIRRDWLYRHHRRVSNLWFTELPTSKFKDLGQTGDTILCEDMAVRDGEGFFLYFYDGSPIVRHFLYFDPAEAARATIHVDEDPPGMRLAARILGTFGLKAA